MSKDNDGSNGIHRTIGGFFKNVGNSVNGAAGKVGNAIGNAAGKTTGIVSKGKDSIVQALDVNGNGKIDIEDIIILGLRVPGVGIKRADFLRAELTKDCTEDMIADAIEHTPAYAGIPVDLINKHADQVIAYERNCVSGIAAVLGMPGGLAMAATIPADIAQYYGFMLRAAQKLLYLYGFPEIDVSEKGQHFDSETINMMTLCLGVMNGVSKANVALAAMANALAKGVEKQLLKRALTKGTIYPIVKSTAKWFGVKMTKQVFAGFFRKSIPVVGGILGGSITYLSFKPCCDKLKDSLKNTILSNPNGYVPIEGEMTITDETDLT